MTNKAFLQYVSRSIYQGIKTRSLHCVVWYLLGTDTSDVDFVCLGIICRMVDNDIGQSCVEQSSTKPGVVSNDQLEYCPPKSLNDS